MSFSIGEIVHFHSARAGYAKYHLCVRESSLTETACFLFFNSKDKGHKDDFILADTEVPGLPASPTGLSIISCSTIVRVNAHQLRIFSAKPVTKVVAAGRSTARNLCCFCSVPHG